MVPLVYVENIYRSMKSQYRELGKNFSVIATGKIISKAIVFFLVSIYTYSLTPEEYGTAELVTTFVALLFPVSSISIYQAVLRYGLSEKYRKQDVFLCGIIVTLSSVIILTALIPVLSFYKSIWKWIFYLTSTVFLKNLLELEYSYLKTAGSIQFFSVLNVLETIFLIVASIVSLVFFQAGIRGYLVSNMISLAVPILMIQLHLNPIKLIKKSHFDKSLFLRMIRYSLPLVLSDISWWVLQSADKAMLEYSIGSYALGIYGIAIKFPAVINLCISLFNQAFSISTFKIQKRKELSSFINDIFECFLMLVLCTCGLFIGCSRIIVSAILNESYREVATYVPFLVYIAIFYALFCVLGTVYCAIEKTKNDMFTSFICALINIALNVLLIRKIGIWGAVASTFVSYFFVSMYRLYDLKNLLSLKYRQMKMMINFGLLALETVAVVQGNRVILVIFLLCAFIVFNCKDIIMYSKYLLKLRQQQLSGE